MVRLEKIAYEKIINSKALHRARTITTPKKTDFFSEVYLRRLPSSRLLHTILSPLKAWMASFEWRFFRSNALQRGISFEDSLMVDDMEFRRGILHEQVNRESMHPYNYQLKMWSRSGFAKVDASMMGFEAPDYIREEVRKQTYMDVHDNILDYKHAILSNYMADMTPITYMGRGSIVVLELFIVHNLFSRSAWNRVFFNEEEYIDSRKYVADFEKMMGGGKLSIATEAGRKKFEARMKKANKKYPGMFAPDGEEFDFKTFYERAKTSTADPSTKKWTRGDLSLLVEGQEKAFMVPEGEELVGKNVVGTQLPSYMKKTTKGIMQ